MRLGSLRAEPTAPPTTLRKEYKTQKLLQLYGYGLAKVLSSLQAITMRFTESFITAAAAAGVSAQNSSQFLFTGANQAGAEFGEDSLPGALGTDYIWPESASIDVCLPGDLGRAQEMTYMF